MFPAFHKHCLWLCENSWTRSCAILPSGHFFMPFFVSITTSSKAFQNQTKRLQKMITQQRTVLCVDSSSWLGQALPYSMWCFPLNLVEVRRFQVTSADCAHTLYYMFAVCMSSKLLLVLALDFPDYMQYLIVTDSLFKFILSLFLMEMSKKLEVYLK